MEEWPTPEARVRSAVWRAEAHIEKGEYYAASSALAAVFDVAGDDGELVRGLHHLATAGFKNQEGDGESARRQLDHARRRLASYPETSTLIALVERELAS